MKKIMYFPAFILLIFITGCQSSGQKKNDKARADSLKEPQPIVNIKVNKVYDDNGNLVRMDSSYVWSYSNIKGDTTVVNADSLLGKFKPFFFSSFPDSLDSKLEHFFPADSLFYHNFFNHDYFFDRFDSQFREMEKMLHRMDSLKRSFINKNLPDFPEPKTGKGPII